MGSGGRRRAPEPRVPGSLRAEVNRETRRLLLMQHNSPGSLPFSHNKHTAKSLASCFDEATCISPFSVYRKLLLKKVILVFTARIKGPGSLAPLHQQLSWAEQESSQLASGRSWGMLPGQVSAKDGGVNTKAKAGTHRRVFSPEISFLSPLERHFLLSEVRRWCKLLPLRGLTFAWSSVLQKPESPFHPAQS